MKQVSPKELKMSVPARARPLSRVIQNIINEEKPEHWADTTEIERRLRRCSSCPKFFWVPQSHGGCSFAKDNPSAAIDIICYKSGNCPIGRWEAKNAIGEVDPGTAGKTDAAEKVDASTEGPWPSEENQEPQENSNPENPSDISGGGVPESESGSGGNEVQCVDETHSATGSEGKSLQAKGRRRKSNSGSKATKTRIGSKRKRKSN